MSGVSAWDVSQRLSNNNSIIQHSTQEELFGLKEKITQIADKHQDNINALENKMAEMK